MEHAVEQLEAAEALLKTLTDQETKMRREAEADGVIDAGEKADLDRIAAKITQAAALIEQKRKELETNRLIWEGKQADWETLKDQAKQLADWGHSGAPDAATLVEGINKAAQDQHWKDATSKLRAAQTSILAPFADYLAAKTAQAVFEPLFQELDTLLIAARTKTDLPDALTAALAQLESQHARLTELAADKKFVYALKRVEGSVADARKLRDDIAAFAKDREEYTEDKANLETLMARKGPDDFPALAAVAQEIDTATFEMQRFAEAKDFAAASQAASTAQTKATTFIAEHDRLSGIKASYEKLLPQIDRRLKSINAPETIALQQQIEQTDRDMRSAAAAGDYDLVLAKQNALLELLGGFEELLANRGLYFDRLAKLTPKIAEYSSTASHLDYLKDLQAELISSQTQMEEAAGKLDFDTALEHMDDIVSIIARCDEAVDLLRRDYETAMAATAEGQQDIANCPYDSLQPSVQAIQTIVAMAESFAKEGDFAAAKDCALQIAEEIETFKQDLTKHEDALIAQIEKDLAPFRAEILKYQEPETGALRAVVNLILKIDKQVADRDDLENARSACLEVARLVDELQVVHKIMADIMSKVDRKQDDAARDIVAEMKADGTLDQLPTEARNYLVETMLDGWTSGADHKASQNIWSDKNYIDPAFDAIDSKKRDSIVAAFKSDPKIKQIEADWPTMDDDAKKKAIEYMVTIPCGPDGWNLATPKVDTYSEKDGKDGNTSYGWYSSSSDTLKVNIHEDAIDDANLEKDFLELLNTVAHEVGHKEQARLVKLYNDGTLKPGAPEYEQARSLALHEEYKSSHKSQFKKIYPTSPKEAHSRLMGDEIDAGLAGP